MVRSNSQRSTALAWLAEMRATIALLALAVPPCALGLVTVKGSAAVSAAHTQFESSTYVFYGPQSGFNVSGPAIYYEGADLSSLGEELVSGKIVVVRLESVTSGKVGVRDYHMFMPMFTF